MNNIYSYVVRYDSGFAPNPFYDYCTLATCKPIIRQHAQIGDWVIGTGSHDEKIRRGGHLVYAMRVTEIMTFDQYNLDSRFESKKPYRNGSQKQSCGDNIYFRDISSSLWQQRDSFHSMPDGSMHLEHMARDTKVNRVLISNDYIYFGGKGPRIQDHLCKQGRGHCIVSDYQLIRDFERWIESLNEKGFQGRPFDWIMLRS